MACSGLIIAVHASHKCSIAQTPCGLSRIAVAGCDVGSKAALVKAVVILARIAFCPWNGVVASDDGDGVRNCSGICFGAFTF